MTASSADNRGHVDSGAVTDQARLRAVDLYLRICRLPIPRYDALIEMAVDAVDADLVQFALVDATHRHVVATGPHRVASIGSELLARSPDEVVISTGQPLSVADLADLPRREDGSAVSSPNGVAYLGVPVADRDGWNVGVLSAWRTPRHDWSGGQFQVLADLSSVISETLLG